MDCFPKSPLAAEWRGTSVIRNTPGVGLYLVSRLSHRSPAPEALTTGVPRSGVGLYLTESVYNVVWQESIPIQILQLILHISDNKDRFAEGSGHRRALHSNHTVEYDPFIQSRLASRNQL